MPYAGAAGRGADLELVAADGNRFAATAAVSPGSTGRGIVILPDVRPSATGLSGGRLSIQDQAPLTLVAVVRGSAWIVPDQADPLALGPGAVAILRGPDPYTVSDNPATAPQFSIHPGQRCTTAEGDDRTHMSGGAVPFDVAVAALREDLIVVDASVLTTALADDGADGDHARARLRGQVLAAPESIDVEVPSVLRQPVLGGELPARRATQALSDLMGLPLRRDPHRPLLARCWSLHEKATIYDASYVALAESLDVLLLTADGRLSRPPGLSCDVELLRRPRAAGPAAP